MKIGVHHIARQTLKAAAMLMLLIGFGLTSQAQFVVPAEADPAAGQTLFKANCASCHAVHKKFTGPALAGVSGRVESNEWTYNWIKNAQSIVEGKSDPYINDLYAEYGSAMNSNPQLSNADIDNIFAWIAQEEVNVPGGNVAGGAATNWTENESLSSLANWARFLILLIVLLIGAVAIQIGRLKGGDSLGFLNTRKANPWLFLVFFFLGIIGFFGSTMAYQEYFVLDDASSEHGAWIDEMFWITMYIITFVFIVTNAVLFFFAWKYRETDEGRKATFYPENHKLELIWTVVPAIVLTILVVKGIITWNKVMATDPDKDAYIVELNAQQFGWNFHYPGPDNKLGDLDLNRISGNNILGIKFEDKAAQDDFIASELYLPKNRDVILKIRSRDVLHSVHLPHFRVKMDAVPGMPTRFVFKPIKSTQDMRIKTENVEFNYELACTEVCGYGHFSMRKIVVVVEPDEYDKWIGDQAPVYDPKVHAVGSMATEETDLADNINIENE